jgi:hypothetical protein
VRLFHIAARQRCFLPGLLGLPWYQSQSLVGLSHTWMDGHILPAGVPVTPVSDRTRWDSRKRVPQAPAAAMPTTGPGSYPDGPTLASDTWVRQYRRVSRKRWKAVTGAPPPAGGREAGGLARRPLEAGGKDVVTKNTPWLAVEMSRGVRYAWRKGGVISRTNEPVCARNEIGRYLHF